jgi:DEAD/DEAH box helicase domain-containing protein
MYADLLLNFSDESGGQESYSTSGDDQAWQEAFDLAHPRVHEVLKTLRRDGWSVPEVGFDLRINERVVAEAELAWPEEKVAYIWPGQETELEVVEIEGWEIRIIEING